MSDPTEAFFTGLAERGHEPLLARAQGTVRVEVQRNGRADEGWTVRIDHGAIKVTRARRADGHLTAERSLFNRMVTGQSNATAAVLRGAALIRGDLELLIRFQRIFPGGAAS